MRLLWLLAVSVCLPAVVFGANILAFFPFPAKSHHILFKPWILELCKRGHKVTYLSPHQFDENVTNLEKIPFPDYWEAHQKWMYKSRKTNPNTIFHEMVNLRGAMFRLANDTLRSPEVVDVLSSNRKYDAVITEALFFSEWISVVAHRFNALSIVIQSFGGHSWSNEMSGLPDNPSYMFDLRYNKAEPPSNVLETLYNIFAIISTVGPSYYSVLGPLQRLIDELVRYPGWENRPRLSMLVADNALVLRNTHHSVGHPDPAAPHVKDVGGLNVDFDFAKKPKLMDSPKFADYKNFMDKSTEGFIYFSLGSIVKPAMMLPSGTFEKIYSALSQVGVNVLMRWNGDDKPKSPSANIKLYNEFLPQMEILAHKNIKLFVTHGGLLSQSETVYFGVPVLGLPVFGDQPMNTRRAASQGYGLTLDIVRDVVSEEEVVAAVKELLQNPKYKKEAERRSELFKDRSMTPVEEAVYWTEYVIRHGKVLQPASVRMPFYQVYLLDVIFTILAATAAVTYSLKLAIKCVLWIIRRPKSQPNRKIKVN